MRLFHVLFTPKSWVRRPRRSARLRLASLSGVLFLVAGVALLAATYALFERATEYRPPALPKIPHTPTIKFVGPQFQTALPQLEYAQHQLGAVVSTLPSTAGFNATNFRIVPGHPASELEQAEHQLARAAHQLSLAVHQVAAAGSLQAAQRASDSHELLVNSGIALAVVAVLALLAGWLVAGRMLRPIRKITRTARRISSSNLHERLALEGPQDELKELGDTLDDLFARLEAAFDAQRHFVANASHELRTPLTRERTLVQVALGDPSTSDVWRATGNELLASNREQETLIEALLTLASSEGGLADRERIDLAELCETALERAEQDADRLGVGVETAIDSAPLDGDPRLVGRLVANLVDNAIGHNVANGRVEVSTGVTHGRAVLSVTNTGQVIPPSEINRLFQPFQRLDGRRARDRNGHGLGLAIVRAIATAHGAAISVIATPSGGLSVDVTFPAPIAAGGASAPVGRVAATSAR